MFYLAKLDTEWLYDKDSNSQVSSLVRSGPKTLWDDLLICQQREREELLRMEEKTLKRSNSIETIRDKVPTAPSIDSTSRSETSSVANSSMSAASSHPATRNESPKRRRLATTESGHMKEWGTRSRAPSISTSSTIGTFDTMSTVSSDWEVPARQAFAIPASNGASPPITPDVGTSKRSLIGRWVMLDASK